MRGRQSGDGLASPPAGHRRFDATPRPRQSSQFNESKRRDGKGHVKERRVNSAAAQGFFERARFNSLLTLPKRVEERDKSKLIVDVAINGDSDDRSHNHFAEHARRLRDRRRQSSYAFPRN